MAAYLSAEWVDALDGALRSLEGATAATEGSLVAQGGSFAILQEVHAVPPEGATARLVLSADAGRLRLVLDDGAEPARPADVTVVVAYDDAAALASGELSPAEAVATGRIKVRGDLSVLVAGQALLAAASAVLAADPGGTGA